MKIVKHLNKMADDQLNFQAQNEINMFNTNSDRSVDNDTEDSLEFDDTNENPQINE